MRMFKKMIAFTAAAAAALSLTACSGGSGAAKSVDVAKVADDLNSSVITTDTLTETKSEMLSSIYFFEEGQVTNSKVYMSANATADEIVAVECKDEAAAKAAEDLSAAKAEAERIAAEEAAAAAAAEAAVIRRYYAVAGAFKEESGAQVYVDKLRENGFKVRTFDFKSGLKVVCVEGSDTLEVVRRDLPALRKIGLDPWIYNTNQKLHKEI